MRFTLNGSAVEVDAHPMARLLDVLRERCGLTGTKEGCGEGECGACTVLIDGAAVCSCLVPAAQVEDAEIMTIEGLGDDHPLQRAFMDEVGAQCGICTPGMILTAIVAGLSSESGEDPGGIWRETSAAVPATRRSIGRYSASRENERVAAGAPRAPHAARRAQDAAGGRAAHAAGRRHRPLRGAQLRHPASDQVPEPLEPGPAAPHHRPRATCSRSARSRRIRRSSTSRLVRTRLPMLVRAAREVGGRQIQNRGTLGGNIANALTRRRYPPGARGGERRWSCSGAVDGERRVPFDRFYTGYRQSVRREPTS